MPTENFRNSVWAGLTIALTAAYALVVALGLRPFDALTLVLFVGPMIIAALSSALLVRKKARLILIAFAVAYSVLSAVIFYWTFAFDQDAQYQLLLLSIPLVGFPSAIVAALIAKLTR